MTLYEKIDYACRKGFYPIIKTEEGLFVIVSPHKTQGRWVHTKECETFEEAVEKIGRWANPVDYWTQLELGGATMLETYYDKLVEQYEPYEKVWYNQKVYRIFCARPRWGEFWYYIDRLGEKERRLVHHKALKPYFEETSTPSKEELTKEEKQAIETVKRLNQEGKVDIDIK